ncbi:hypothetical protein U1Q18_019335 [Sarracenia purpurea var. burkii]
MWVFSLGGLAISAALLGICFDGFSVVIGFWFDGLVLESYCYVPCRVCHAFAQLLLLRAWMPCTAAALMRHTLLLCSPDAHSSSAAIPSVVPTRSAICSYMVCCTASPIALLLLSLQMFCCFLAMLGCLVWGGGGLLWGWAAACLG